MQSLHNRERGIKMEKNKSTSKAKCKPSLLELFLDELFDEPEFVLHVMASVAIGILLYFFVSSIWPW